MPALKYRRLWGDMIEVFKITRNIYDTTPPVKKWRILLEQSFSALMLLLMATSAIPLNTVIYSMAISYK